MARNTLLSIIPAQTTSRFREGSILPGCSPRSGSIPAVTTKGRCYNSKTKKYSKPINVPGAAQTYIHSVNSAGGIVFLLVRLERQSLWRTADRQDVFSDPKGPDYTKPDDINDKRDVVGRFESTSSRSEQSLEATY